MKRLVIMVMVMTVAQSVVGSDIERDVDVVNTSAPSILHLSTGLSAAKSDTVDIYGGPDSGDGKFQSDANPNIPDWEGWTSSDLTARTAEIWHIDTFNSPTGTNAMWCGEVFDPCDPDDPAEGYGNDYREIIGWYGAVSDPGAATSVTVTFDLNHDMEETYDFLYLEYESGSYWNRVASYTGSTYDAVAEAWVPLIGESFTFSVAAADLVGPFGDQVHLRFQAYSDGAYSDDDCLSPSAGHSQIDNIAVSGDNGLAATLDDFESGLEGSNWQLEFLPGVGLFAKVWPLLADLDPCVENRTCQVAFIDDGVVEPCTGGTIGTTWTYGPGSYVHNLTGGCLDFSAHLNNEIWSPPVAYADAAGTPLRSTHEGAFFEFDVYEHLVIDNGLFWHWHVSSSEDGGATWGPWLDRNFMYYGPERYRRIQQRVDDLIAPNATHVRLALGIIELGWVWGLEGTNGSPGPYFDNVRFRVFEIDGPLVAAVEYQTPQDAFPESGVLDYADLGANNIRFDMAGDIAWGPANVPGDSVVFNVQAVRSGAALVGKPRLHYVMKANPLFDPYRTHPTTGFVEGDSVAAGASYYTPTGLYAFDLPDTGLFFPGDVIHYYVAATDEQGGVMRTATLPESLDGFGVFPGDPDYRSMLWPGTFTVHGLPTMLGAEPGDQPPLLFYNDYGSGGGLDEWMFAFDRLGYVRGEDYDVYTTRAASLKRGSGLQSRATPAQLQSYQSMIYTSGDLAFNTLTSQDPDTWNNDANTDDIGLLDAWLQNGRNLLLTGDHLLGDVAGNQGASGVQFASQWLSAGFVQDDVSPLIGGQITPLVLPAAGDPIGLQQYFIAYGGCDDLATFDAVEPLGSAVTVAEWTDAGGAGGAYPTLAAGVLNETGGSKVVFFPVDFLGWWSHDTYAAPAGYDAQTAARDVVLHKILAYFGNGASSVPTSVAVSPAPSLGVYPNPFNPSTTIAYAVPARGRVDLRIYNVRGELVRVLVDGEQEMGTYEAEWNGDDQAGRRVPSGIYFSEVRTTSGTLVEKLALIK